MHYRDNGAIGALLDEYQKSIDDLIAVCTDISKEELLTIVDKETSDPDCVSIQTILTHVVESGYTYSVEIYNHLGIQTEYKQKMLLDDVAEYISSLSDMFNYCEDLFQNISNDQLVNKDPSTKIKVRWGQYYDIDQLMEHAIVHILRHRRQIERFLIILRK